MSCSSLTSVVIGEGVTYVDEDAFDYCSSLQSVYYKGDESDWKNISGVCIYCVIDNTSGYYVYADTSLTRAIRYDYSESEPTTAGNYWHYDANGNVVLW